MSDQVVQWLNEIKELKQQLQEAQEAQNVANASADNWRKRYETEAQQRRTEAMLTRQTIAALTSEVNHLKDLPQPSTQAPVLSSSIERSINVLQTAQELKLKLLEVWSERDRLAQDLKTEQANHIQTRKNLTTALGDAVDMLTKQRGMRENSVPSREEGELP